MITQVIAPNTGSFIRDPRRKSRVTRLKNSSNIPYEIYHGQDSEKNHRSPIWTGTSIALGSVLFMILYFLLTGANKLKK